MTFNISDFDVCYSVVFVTMNENYECLNKYHVGKIFKSLDDVKAYCSYKNLVSRRRPNEFYTYENFMLYKEGR